jgi:hypothetical protein
LKVEPAAAIAAAGFLFGAPFPPRRSAKCDEGENRKKYDLAAVVDGCEDG